MQCNGYDISLPTIPVAELERCKEVCAGDTDCGGFLIWGNHCNFKGTNCPLTDKTGATTYVKQND